MFVAVFLMFLVCRSSAEPDKVIYRCNDDNSNKDTSMTFNRSSDGLEGRYTAKLCTKKNPLWTEWTIDLTYDQNPNCTASYYRGRRPSPQHSSNTLNISDELTNCTYLCYSMNFDLIFSACYGVKSTFSKGRQQYAPLDSYHLIDNNLTEEYFSDNKAHAYTVNHDDGVSLFWFLGIPATEYKVVICKKQNNTLQVCDQDVSGNCSVQEVRAVQCSLAPPHGCYHALFTHEASWTVGVFTKHTLVSYDFCHQAAPPPLVEASGGLSWVWWLCGGMVAAAALLVAPRLCRHLTLRDYLKQLLSCLKRERAQASEEEITREMDPQNGAHISSSEEEAPALQRDSRPVLLLFAREGELGMKAMHALQELIETTTGGKVYSLFSAEVVALAGAAPEAWVRGMLAREDVRVLLVQTPAIAALYEAHLQDHDAGLRLRQPLLGRRAWYRRPQYGDTLLQYALQLAARDAHNHHLYQKYYLATLSGLETDIVRALVPYRRYVLPGAAAALCRDVGGAPAERAALSRLRGAAAQLAQHARDNPDYLADELVLH